MLRRGTVLFFVVLVALFVSASTARSDEWIVQEDPDYAEFDGCWSVYPTNYDCDGEPYLIDGNYETGSFSYIQNQDAVMWTSYLIPDDAEISKWCVSFKNVNASGPLEEVELFIDLDGHPGGIVDTRITVHNSGSVGSPFSFAYHDGSEWIELYADVTGGGLASAIIFEERVEWLIDEPVANQVSSWSHVKTLHR